MDAHTDSDSFNAYSVYRSLCDRCKRLQEQKAECELGFKQSALYPEFYPAERLAEIRERYYAVSAELERVTREEGSLLEANPGLREQLERECFASNGHGVEDGASCPSASAEKPIVTLCPSELIARPISSLVEQIVITAMLTVLHACDKVGKTLLTWEIALAALKKNLLFSTFSTTQGRVVLALLDDPHDLTVQRRDALGLTDCEELRIVTPMDADLSDSLAFLAEFKKECEEFKPNLIVLDALHQFAPPGTEEEIFQVFPSLRDLGFTHVKSELKERSKAHKPFSAQEGSRE